MDALQYFVTSQKQCQVRPFRFLAVNVFSSLYEFLSDYSMTNPISVVVIVSATIPIETCNSKNTFKNNCNKKCHSTIDNSEAVFIDPSYIHSGNQKFKRNIF